MYSLKPHSGFLVIPSKYPVAGHPLPLPLTYSKINAGAFMWPSSSMEYMTSAWYYEQVVPGLY